MEKVIDRLFLFIDFLIESKKVKSKASFGKKVGISQAYLSNTKANDGAISSDIMIRINKEYPNLNLDWLITGRGSMQMGDWASKEYGDLLNELSELKKGIKDTEKRIKKAKSMMGGL